MNAIERLFEARQGFDVGWRSHSAALRSLELLNSSGGLDAALSAAISMSKGFSPGVDSREELADLRDEIVWLRDLEFEPLRWNCLLGVCANFEASAKVAATALTFGPNWRSNSSDLVSLREDCDDRFDKKLGEVGAKWQGQSSKFLEENFPWVSEACRLKAVEVLWLRNQVAHNGGRAKVSKTLQGLGMTLVETENIRLDRVLLSRLIGVLRGTVVAVFGGTPYLDMLDEP